MAATVQYRQEEMSSGATEKEKGDDLTVFVDFNGVNLNMDLHQKSNQFQEILDSDSDTPLMPETNSIKTHGADDLLNSENNTTDYDWLLSPPRKAVLSLEMEEQKTLTGQNLISNGQSTSPESQLENPPTDKISTTKVAPKLPSSSIKPSLRRPSPSRKPPPTVSRSTTPTTRPTLPSTTKQSRSSTPTPRSTTTTTTKPAPPSKRSTTPTRPSARSSTPTARPSTLPSSKSTSRSSTPTPRPTVPAPSKSTSRSSTPTPRPTNPPRSSSVTKPRVPSNIKKSLPERPASATRGRPGVTETNVKVIPKRTSSSPSRRAVLNGVKTGVTKSRGYTNGSDEVNPVLMGTKMVERVVNMRKLAPPREERASNQNNTSGKLSVSQDNSGFGRSLSKKSFDMALRHLDIRRSMPGNMRAMITKVPASSVYSVRSESTKNHTISASDSPLATSSSASSDHSIGKNQSFIDGHY